MAATRSQVRLVRLGLALWDMLSWVGATVAIVAARYDFVGLRASHQRVIVTYAVSAMLLQLIMGWSTQLYRGRHRLASINEAITLAVITIVIGGLLGVFFWIWGGPAYPRGITIMVPPTAILAMAAGRFVARAWLNRDRQDSPSQAEPVLVYGAGNAGQQLARLLVNDPDAPYRIVGFIDDDPTKRNLHLARGARVLGGEEKLVSAANELGVETVIIAIPALTKERLREINHKTERAGFTTLIMPPVKDIVGGRVQIDQLHQIDTADLLGRSQIKTNLSEIAGYLSGKVVLVTGAGGSIGSEIARQVHTFGPKELVLLDRDESALADVQLSIYGRALLDTPNMVLCDIRDLDALDRIFADHKPEVIFHAAALKHLPMLEQYPAEGWKTNVLGSLNVLTCAEKHGVSRYVNISTDKAADATSVLGKTKRIAEELTAHFAHRTGQNYLSVRFGNVLGSRGSMLNTFTKQIEAGGPVTVTHPDIERFFMTIPEACELTIQAGAIGEPGDVLVLDMGEPVKILDVAKGLIARSGKRIDIVFTGLRPNEKLSEVLFSGDEQSISTSHPLINRVNVPAIDPADLEKVDPADPDTMALLTQQTAVAEVIEKNQRDAATAHVGETLEG